MAQLTHFTGQPRHCPLSCRVGFLLFLGLQGFGSLGQLHMGRLGLSSHICHETNRCPPQKNSTHFYYLMPQPPRGAFGMTRGTDVCLHGFCAIIKIFMGDVCFQSQWCSQAHPTLCSQLSACEWKRSEPSSTVKHGFTNLCWLPWFFRGAPQARNQQCTCCSSYVPAPTQTSHILGAGVGQGKARVKPILSTLNLFPFSHTTRITY